MRFPTLPFLALLLLAPLTLADDYPQWLGPKRDNVYREPDLAEAFPTAGPKVLWRAPVGGGYAGMAVAGDRVILTDRQLKPGTAQPKDPFQRGSIPGTERVLCLDDATGKELWRVEYDCPYTISYAAGPRATPAVDSGRVYTLGAQGHVYCIDIKSGKTIWNKRQGGDAPMWGFAGSPVVEGDLVIVLGSGKPLVTAFDKVTGDIAWTAGTINKFSGYVPPTPHTFPGGRRQIVQYYAEGILGLDPTTGKVLWQQPHGPEDNGVAIITPLFVSDDTFVLSGSYTGAAAIQITPDDKPHVLWQAKSRGRTPTTLHSLQSQMVFHEGHVYGVSNAGDLLCMDPKNGKVVWADTKPLLGDGERRQWTAGFLTPWQPDPKAPAKHFYLGTETGDLILCDLSTRGYKEISRAHLLDPVNADAGRPTLWSHPAYAHQSIYWRNDKEILRASLAK
jgi:outer membrane protein assembly factor BamB